MANELITVEQFKEHARIDGDSEDSAIALKVAAVNSYIISFLASPLPDDWTAPNELVQAAFLVASHWWENREATATSQLLDIPIGASDLIANHREWVFG